MATRYYTDYKKGEYKSYDAYYRGYADITLNSGSTDDKYGIYIGNVGIGKKAGVSTQWSSGRVRKTTVTVDGTSYTKSASGAIKWQYDDGTHDKNIGSVGSTKYITKGTTSKTISLKVYAAYCEGHSSYAWYFTVSKTWSITIPAKSVTVTYNANGGSNAPSSVKQTCDKAFSLGGGCTRTNYNFKGWATSANATSATYSVGQSVKFTSNTTLYAVWERAFQAPSITDLKAYRVSNDAEGATPDVSNPGTRGFCRFKLSGGYNYQTNADGYIKTNPSVIFGTTDITSNYDEASGYYYAYTDAEAIEQTATCSITVKGTAQMVDADDVTLDYSNGTFISTEIYVWDAYSQNGITSFAVGGLADSENSKFDCYMNAEFKSDNYHYGESYYEGKTVKVGNYYSGGVFSSSSSSITFTVPLGCRLAPNNRTIDNVQLDLAVRASNSNGTGLYVFKSSSGGYSPQTINSNANSSFYNGANTNKTLTPSMWNTYITSDGAMLYICIENTAESYFYSGNSTNNSYTNNNAISLSVLNFVLTLA